MARKEHSYHYIYKTTCNATGKYYIGMHSTSNLEDGYIGSGRRLWLSINKYGKENHSIEILEWLPDRSSLKLREREMVNESLLSNPMCMNLVLGGGGGFISIDGAKKGAIAMNKVTWSNLEFREKKINEIKKRNSDRVKMGLFIPLNWTGKKHSEETKQKIGKANSLNQIGEKNSQYGTCWITDGKRNLKIKKEDLFLYPQWKKGRKIK